MSTTEADIESDVSHDRSTGEVVGGLEENIAGALCYVLGFVTGIIFYLIEERNEFVRFHAMQSILVFGGLFILGIAISFIQIMFEFIPVIGWIFSLMFGIVGLLIAPIAFILWIVLMYKAYSGDRYKLPIVGDIAERNV